MNAEATRVQMSTEIEYPVLDVIRRRRSKRAYLNKPVEEEKINSLFEAARWAPSGVNEQPWKYIYATREQPELWNKIFESLNETNKIWAKEAPLLIVSLCKKTLSRNGQINVSAKYDLGGANAFLGLQAEALGLNVHQMGGYHHQTLRENLRIPEDYETGVVLAIGYAGNPDTLPEHLKQRELAPRVRFVQEQFVMNKPF